MLDVSAKQGIFNRIRLVIVDRQPIVLQGLKSVLGAQHDFDVVASCSDGTSCLEAIRNLTPDIALIADSLPDLTISGILATAKAENLSTRLVFFTESESDHDLTAAVAAGTCSEISKYASPDTMLRLLRLLTKRSASSEQFDLSLVGKEADGGAKIEKMLELLTHRERQIVRLVSEGMSNKEIARQLNVSPGTVKVHLYNIFQKLEITNRTVLATLALLQRPSGFGTLALAFLAVAIADELKAAEANDMLPNDGSIVHAGENGEYEPWKKAILRHLIVWESAETPPLTQRDFFAKLSHVTSPAAATEALRAAEQSLGAISWKDYGPAGSSTLNLPTPLLRGTSDTRIGADPAPEHQFPPLASKPMLIQGGYGTFATLAGALIYALQDPHLAAQSHDPDQASIDSFVVVTGENATTTLAAITNADANHADNSAPGFLAHDFRLPSASVTTENQSVTGDGAQRQMSHVAADDNLQKPPDLVDFRHETSIGGDGRDQAMGGNVGEHVVYRSNIDSNLTSPDSVFDFASGSSRINLAAFGALAWLHMTAATKSIPPRTVAWAYDAASNETIVYVNPTDRTLDIGDRGLLEFHLQGIVAIAEADVVSQPDGAAVAATLEQLEGALTSAKATDETVLSTGNVHGIVGSSESTLGTAGVWSVLADAGLSFHFGQTRTGFGASTQFRTFTTDSTDATEESAGASGVSAHVSSIALAQSATVPAVENPALKSEPINADTDVLSTGQNETVEPSAATADSAERGNSQHASEQGSAKAATEMAEAKSSPGIGVGHDKEHHSQASDGSPGSKKTAEPGGVEHGNSGHSTSAKAPEAAGIAATADSAERGNSQHASEQGSAKAATEMAEAKSSPGNGVGHDKEHDREASDDPPGPKKTAEPGGVEHGNSGHSTSAKAPEAAEIAATAASAERGNSQHASEPGSAKAATEMAEAKSNPGNGVGHDKEHHREASDDPPGPKKTAEPGGVEHGNSGHSTSAKAPEAAEIAATAASADRGNSHHASEPGSAKTATTDVAEADFISGNGVGKGAEHRAPASDAASASAVSKTAEPAVVEHGNSGHDLPSTSANASAAEIVKPSVASGDHAGRGNSEHVAPSAAIALEAPQPAKAAPETGGVDRELVFRFDREATPATLVAAVEPKELHNPLDAHVPRGQEANLEMIVKALPNGLEEHAANDGNNGAHHAIVPASHDLLI
ncbi:LuxR C-terminal-related transcriptional regulator [Bradyrhizobium sp. CCGB12]|uniref:LuxR C-terminal-related transcriptional regulator n=1 Tax=Bradyrhizobium sp. CCGB12 TaxID=2949632 RepID=UPI0020B24FA0|nr:LuxR C-terminal-related transcriptional regulator [Bradyrhizobium sp. CCGB12]MCP3391126.1 LuxR C-terminal-related transcriptional regulator [Bradyrhizobium sp. CCGB12]